ncbi:MAG: hypothetical protein CSA68_09135 [Rhodobacterales bacterium]|nr:MAG: hypothetical protein CSA68_09135 [Rhodobacterales bacterium]
MTEFTKWQRPRGLLCQSACMVALLGAVSMPASAADMWTSGVTITKGGAPVSMTAKQFAKKTARGEFATSATAVFDISISLEANPQGDDDYPADPGAADDDQNAFEAKLEEFADAVYQSTNGAHKIGKITIFRDGDLSGLADVTWEESCASNNGPWAYPSTFGKSGGYIHMCTTWSGAPSLMDTPRGGGFTLAHEWGHYAYGVYDEYVASQCSLPDAKNCGPQPHGSDTAASPSIMNNQWNAAQPGGDQNWLEFSTSNIAPYNGSGSNAHKRVFGESIWDTLARDPATDPKLSYLPERTQYTTLTAPVAPNFIVNDSETTARSELDIVWAGDQVVELMLDTSGSMMGSPLANAKTASQLLIDQLPEGEAAIGVGRFSSSPSQVYAITDIPDPDTGVRAAAKAAVAGLTDSGLTDIEAAAIYALNQTQGFQGGVRPSVVYLLSDGHSTTSAGYSVADVITDYNAAKVPLITFGFGTGADEATLTNLATSTGGKYFYSPTTLAEIQQAFLAANAAYSSNVFVSSTSTSAPASDTTIRPIVLDSTLANAMINVTYDGPQSDVTLSMLDPSNKDIGANFQCEGTSEVSCSTNVDVTALGSGVYSLRMANSSTGEKDISILVGADVSGFETYNIAVDFDNTNYPSSLTLTATANKGAGISGLNVAAVITKPDTSTMIVGLSDDGTGEDERASDGIYTATVPYSADGSYTAVVTASNSAGSAQLSYEGIAISVQEDGTGVQPGAASLPENFTRTASAAALVSGYNTDDHANDPAVPAACTVVSDDNTDTAGRIDSAGDVDCFSFVPSATSSDLVVRATGLSAGMQPELVVYNAAGTSELARVTLATSDNSKSGAITTIAAGDLDAAGHVVTVEHEDATADSGNYAVSVGSKLISDEPAAPTGGGGGGGGTDDGGGAFGPWMLFFAAFLSLIGLRQRRSA